MKGMDPSIVHYIIMLNLGTLVKEKTHGIYNHHPHKAKVFEAFTSGFFQIN